MFEPLFQTPPLISIVHINFLQETYSQSTFVQLAVCCFFSRLYMQLGLLSAIQVNSSPVRFVQMHCWVSQNGFLLSVHFLIGFRVARVNILARNHHKPIIYKKNLLELSNDNRRKKCHTVRVLIQESGNFSIPFTLAAFTYRAA